METPVSLVESLFEKAEAYSKVTYELSKLKTVETTAVVITSLISQLSVIVMASVCAVFLSIAVALLLGSLLGKTFYGFFIVAAFYLVAAIVLHFFLERWIKKPVSSLIITQALGSS